MEKATSPTCKPAGAWLGYQVGEGTALSAGAAAVSRHLTEASGPAVLSGHPCPLSFLSPSELLCGLAACCEAPHRVGREASLPVVRKFFP